MNEDEEVIEEFPVEYEGEPSAHKQTEENLEFPLYEEKKEPPPNEQKGLEEREFTGTIEQLRRSQRSDIEMEGVKESVIEEDKEYQLSQNDEIHDLHEQLKDDDVVVGKKDEAETIKYTIFDTKYLNRKGNSEKEPENENVREENHESEPVVNVEENVVSNKITEDAVIYNNNNDDDADNVVLAGNTAEVEPIKVPSEAKEENLATTLAQLKAESKEEELPTPKMAEIINQLPKRYPPKESKQNADLKDVLENCELELEGNNVDDCVVGEVPAPLAAKKSRPKTAYKKQQKVARPISSGVSKNRRELVHEGMRIAKCKPQPTNKGKSDEELKKKEEGWNARLVDSNLESKKKSTSNIKKKPSIAKQDKLVAQYLKERESMLRTKAEPPQGKYKHPAQVQLPKTAKVDALGIKGQLKDMESLRDELKVLRKEKAGLIRENQKLQETLQNYDHQKTVLEAEVTKTEGNVFSEIVRPKTQPAKLMDLEEGYVLWKLFAKMEAADQSLEDFYNSLDKNGDNVLTKEEISAGLMNEENKNAADELFKLLDENTDGVVSKRRIYANYKELKEIVEGTDFDDPISLQEKILDLKQRIELERERGLKKAEKVQYSNDPEYNKTMLKLFSLEKQGKIHEEEIMKREQDFQEKLKELDEAKVTEYVETINNLHQEKIKVQKEFEEAKAALNKEIQEAESKYSEALMEALKNKENFYKAEKSKKELLSKQSTLRAIEERLDNKILEQYKNKGKHALQQQIDMQYQESDEFKEQLNELLKRLL